jgi:hypothetical protein
MLLQEGVVWLTLQCIALAIAVAYGTRLLVIAILIGKRAACFYDRRRPVLGGIAEFPVAIGAM